jgi:hypothetical protein
MAGGTYPYLELDATKPGKSGLAKGSSVNPARLVPADTSNRPMFKPSYASRDSALYITGCSGIAVEGCTFAIDDWVVEFNGGGQEIDYRILCSPGAGNSNIWIVANEFYSNRPTVGITNKIDTWKGYPVTGLHVLGNFIHDIGQGWVGMGDDSEFAFNRFKRIVADWCSFGDGVWNFSFYFNYTLEPESSDGDHSDGFQTFSDGSTTRRQDRLRLYNNFAICPADLPPDSGTHSSLARMQFFILGNEADFQPYPTGIIVHSNKGRGCITNTMLLGLGTGGLIKNNEAWHIRGTYSGGGDSTLNPSLDSTKIEIGGGGTGAASGNDCYLFNNLAPGFTGQASTAANPARICTFAEAQTALFAWLATGDFAQARAAANLPTDRFLPF